MGWPGLDMDWIKLGTTLVGREGWVGLGWLGLAWVCLGWPGLDMGAEV